MSGVRVHMAMPTTGEVRAETMLWVMAYANHPYVMRFTCNIGQLGVAVQRNFLCDALLASDATHLFFMDDDVVPPSAFDALKRMVDHDKDIVTGVYPLQLQDKMCPAVYRLFPDATYDINDDSTLEQENLIGPVAPVDEGLEKCDASGGGCLLIKRRVIEEMPKPWFCFPPFTDRDKRMGEDIYFGLKAKQYGFQMYVDWTVRCAHYKAVRWNV